MALARVVAFDRVAPERVAEMKRQLDQGERPDGVPATEIIMLHDPPSEKALVILLFDNDEDYRRGDETLSAMPAGDTPGHRTSVTRYEVAGRTTA